MAATLVFVAFCETSLPLPSFNFVFCQKRRESSGQGGGQAMREVVTWKSAAFVAFFLLELPIAVVASSVFESILGLGGFSSRHFNSVWLGFGQCGERRLSLSPLFLSTTFFTKQLKHFVSL